jgi:protein TonB
MFEQATLTNGPAGVRAWTTFLGLTSQVAIVGLAVMVPMVFPQVLPLAHIVETLAPPLPPAPPPRPLGNEMRTRPSRPGLARFTFHGLIAPTSVPRTPIPIIEDEPAGPQFVGMPVGLGGPGGGIPGGIMEAGNAAVVVPRPPVVRTEPKPAAEAAPVIPRYREGGNFKLGALLHRTEPPYPAMAKAARVSGMVELECVVGVDGHITEVKVKGGNPLLIRAAVDAAWQWVYAPSKLNGTPIEIITKLIFTFKLN